MEQFWILRAEIEHQQRERILGADPLISAGIDRGAGRGSAPQSGGAWRALTMHLFGSRSRKTRARAAASARAASSRQ